MRRLVFDVLSPAFASLAIVLFAAGGVMLLPAQAFAQGGGDESGLCPDYCGSASPECEGTVRPCSGNMCSAAFPYCNLCRCWIRRVGDQDCHCI
jgi:hypothetical protein